MISKTFLSSVIAAAISIQLLMAQEKLPVSISFAVNYPLYFGDNSWETTSSLLGLDVNAQFPVSHKFSVGPSIRTGIYGDKIEFTDENGQVTHTDFYSSILTHTEVLSEYQLRLSDEFRLRFGLAAGYSFMHVSNLYSYLPGKSPKGFDISPGVTLQFSVSEHFVLLTSAKYTFTNLTSSSDVSGTVYKTHENLHEVNLAVGAGYLF